jgi:hypothetical protein
MTKPQKLETHQMKLKWWIAFGVLIAMAASGKSHADGIDAGERFAFFEKVGIMKRAAAVCGDTDLDQASVSILNTPQVQNLTPADALATAGIATGVVAFNNKVEEQGLAFNCQLVKALAIKDGYLK